MEKKGKPHIKTVIKEIIDREGWKEGELRCPVRGKREKGLRKGRNNALPR